MVTKLPKMSLAEYSTQIKIGHVDCKTAAVLILNLGKSLEKIHRKRIIHRDICFENIDVRTVKNVETNMKSGIDSDHYPITMEVETKLKRIKQNKTKPRCKYGECNLMQKSNLNDNWEFEWDNSTHTQAIHMKNSKISPKK